MSVSSPAFPQSAPFAGRRQFVRQTLAVSSAARFSGRIRANGSEGGGGMGTAEDPWQTSTGGSTTTDDTSVEVSTTDGWETTVVSTTAPYEARANLVGVQNHLVRTFTPTRAVFGPDWPGADQYETWIQTTSTPANGRGPTVTLLFAQCFKVPGQAPVIGDLPLYAFSVTASVDPVTGAFDVTTSRDPNPLDGYRRRRIIDTNIVVGAGGNIRVRRNLYVVFEVEVLSLATSYRVTVKYFFEPPEIEEVKVDGLWISNHWDVQQDDVDTWFWVHSASRTVVGRVYRNP